MAALHPAHFPRSNSQLMTGMFSVARMGLWHEGQADRRQHSAVPVRTSEGSDADAIEPPRSCDGRRVCRNPPCRVDRAPAFAADAQNEAPQRGHHDAKHDAKQE